MNRTCSISVAIVMSFLLLQFANAPAGTGDGWEFEPAARIAYGDRDTNRVVPYLEWYSELGSLPSFVPRSSQVHQVFQSNRGSYTSPGSNSRLGAGSSSSHCWRWPKGTALITR
jgi:hypothetical protein